MSDLKLAASWDGETRSVKSEHPWVDRKEVRDICLSKTTSVHPGKTMIYTFRNSLSSPKLAGHIFNSPTGEHFVSSDVIQLQQTLPDKKTQRNSIESVEISSMILAGLPHQVSTSQDVTGKPSNTMTISGQKQTDKPQVRPVRLPPAPPPPRSTSLQTTKAPTEPPAEPPTDPEFVPQLLRHTLLEDSPGAQTGTKGSEPGTKKDERSHKGAQLMAPQRGDDQSESSVDSDVSSDDVSMTFPVPNGGTRFFTAKDRDVDFSKRLSNKLSEPLPGDEEGEEMHKTKRGHNPLKRFFARKKGKYDPSADLQFGHSVLPSLDSDVQDAKKKKKNSPKNEKKKSYDPTKDKEAKKPEAQKSKLTKDSIVVIKSSGKCLTDVSIDMATAESDTRDGHSENPRESDEDVDVTDVNGPSDMGEGDSDNKETDTRYKIGNYDDDDYDKNEVYANFPTVQRRKTAGVIMNEPAKLSTFFAPAFQASAGGDDGKDQEEEKEDKSGSSSSDEEEQVGEADHDDENDCEEIYVNSMFIPKLNRPLCDEPTRNAPTSSSRSSDQSSDKFVRTACDVFIPDADFHEKTIVVDDKFNVSTTDSVDVTQYGQLEFKLSKGDSIEPRVDVSIIISDTYSQVEKSDKKGHMAVSNDETASPVIDDSPEINEPLKRFGTMENLGPEDSHVITSDISTEVNVKAETDVRYGPNNVASTGICLIPTAAHNPDKPSKKVEHTNDKDGGIGNLTKENTPTSSIEHIERFLGPDGEATTKKSSSKTEQDNHARTMASPTTDKLLHTPSKRAQSQGAHVQAQGQNKIIDGHLEADPGGRVVKSHQRSMEKEGRKVDNENVSLQTNDNARNLHATAGTIHVSSAKVPAAAVTKTVVQAPEKPPPKGIYSIIKSRTNPPAVIATNSSSVNTRNDPSLDAVEDSRSTPAIPKRPTTSAAKPFTLKTTSVSISPQSPHNAISTSVNLVQPPNTTKSQPIPSPDPPIPGTIPPSSKPSRPPPTKPKPPTWKMKTMIRKFESPESDAASAPTKPGARLTTRGSEENINKDLIEGVLKELDDYIDTDLKERVEGSKHAESSSDMDATESVVSCHQGDVDSQVYERFIERFPDPPDSAVQNLDHVDAETERNEEIGKVIMRGGEKDLKSTGPGHETKDHGSSVQPRVETAKYEEVVDWDLSTITSAKVLITHQEKMSDNSRSEKGEEMSSLTSKMADRGYDDVVDKIADEKAEKIYDEIREANGDESPTSKCFKFNWKKRDASVSETSKTEKGKTRDDKERDKKKVKIHKDKTATERTHKEKNGPDGKHREKSGKKKDKGKKHGLKGRSLSNSSSHGKEDGSESSSQKSGSSSSLQPSSEDSEYEVVGSPEITKLRVDRDIKEHVASAESSVEPLKDAVHGADSYGYEIPAKYSIKRYDTGNVKLSLKDESNRDVNIKSDTNTNERGAPDVDEAKKVLGELAKQKVVLKNSRVPDLPDHVGVLENKENSHFGDSKENLISVEAGTVGISDAQLRESDWSTVNVANNKPCSISAEPKLLNSTLEAGFNVTHTKEPSFDSKENSKTSNVPVGVDSRDTTISHPLAKDQAVKTSTKSHSKPVTGVLVAQHRIDRPKEDKPKHHGSSSGDTSSTSGDSDSDEDERSKKSHKRKKTHKAIPTVHVKAKTDVPDKEIVTSPKITGRDEIKRGIGGDIKTVQTSPSIEVKEKDASSPCSSLNERPVLTSSVAVNDPKVKTLDAKLKNEKTHNIKTGTQGLAPKYQRSTDMKVGQLAGVDVSQSIAKKYQSHSVQGELMAVHLQAPNIKTSEIKNKEVGLPLGEKSKAVPTQSLLMSQGDRVTPRNDAELSVFEIPDVHSMSELDEDPWKDYSALELGKNTRDLSPRQWPRLGEGANKETTDDWFLDVPDTTSHVTPDTADRARSLPPDHAAPPVPRIRSSLQMTNESVDLSDLSSAKLSFNNKLKTDDTHGGTVIPDMEIYSDGTSEPGTLAIDKQRAGGPNAVLGNPLKLETIAIKGEHDKNDDNHLKIETETRERQYDQLPVRMRKSGNATSAVDPVDVPATLFFESPRLPSAGSKGKSPAEKSEYAEPWEEKKFEELPPLQPAFINSRSSSEYSGNSANQARMSLTSEDLHPASVIDFKVGTMNRSTSLDQVPGGKPSKRTKTADDGKKGISLGSLSSLFHRNKKDKKGSKTDDSENENANLSDNQESDDDARPDKSKRKKEKQKKTKPATEQKKKPEKRKSDKDKTPKAKKPTETDKGQRSSLIDQPDDMEMMAEGTPLCRLIRVNEDGSRDVELTRPQSEPLGIFFSKGRETKKDGLVVKSFLDKHAKKLFAGILRVGDEIIEIDESDICPLTLDEVKDIIQQKERMVIKLCPLEGGERTMNLTSSGPL